MTVCWTVSSAAIVSGSVTSAESSSLDLSSVEHALIRKAALSVALVDNALLRVAVVNAAVSVVLGGSGRFTVAVIDWIARLINIAVHRIIQRSDR